MEKVLFKDAGALLRILLGATGGGIDQLFDLSRLPRRMMEFEKKYRLSTTQTPADLAISGFLSNLNHFFTQSKMEIVSLTTFVGIDQYFIVNNKKNEYIFRYRLGANRLPQLTVKFQMSKGSNVARGEINLDVRYEEPDRVRAFMAVICSLVQKTILFTIQQSGNIWTIKEPDGDLVEFVVYKVDRISPPNKIEAFAEIEPLDSSKASDHARTIDIVNTIDKYEKELNLGSLVCEQSIAEIFRPE
jgi:CYTH domain-containing protein